MNLPTRILLGVCAFIIAFVLVLPTRAAADNDDHDDHDRGRHGEHYDHDRDDHHQSWRWQWDKDYYRGYPYTPPPKYYGYWQQHQYLPENGEGMINPRNPNLYWACDSDGHHCHWAPRPRRRWNY